MPLPIASHKDSIFYKGSSIPMKGLCKIQIDFERRQIIYEVNVDTTQQNMFVENTFRKNAIVFDKTMLNSLCEVHIFNEIQSVYKATFLSFVYNTRKNKYQCIFVQSFSENETISNVPKESEPELETELPSIDDNKFNTLDIS